MTAAASKLSLALVCLAVACGCSQAPNQAPTPSPSSSEEPQQTERAQVELSITTPPSGSQTPRHSWRLHDAAGREIESATLVGPVARTLELSVPELYVVEITTLEPDGSRRVTPLPLWLPGPAQARLDIDIDVNPKVSRSNPWTEAWTISTAWERELLAAYRADGEPGIEALAERSRAIIADQAPELELLLRFRWYATFAGMIAAPGTIEELAELAPADDPAWTALGVALAHVGRREVQTPASLALLTELAEAHPAASVRANARFALLLAAEAANDDTELERHFRALDVPGLRGTEPHQWAMATYDPDRPLAPGQRLRPRTFPDLDDPNREHQVSGARDRPQLVIVWSSHCHFCEDEQPSWEAAHERFGKQVDFVSICVDDRADEQLAATRRQWPMPWAQAFVDEASFTALRESWAFDGVPMLVLIDEQGEILASGQELRGPKLAAQLEAL